MVTFSSRWDLLAVLAIVALAVAVVLSGEEGQFSKHVDRSEDYGYDEGGEWSESADGSREELRVAAELRRAVRKQEAVVSAKRAQVEAICSATGVRVEWALGEVGDQELEEEFREQIEKAKFAYEEERGVLSLQSRSLLELSDEDLMNYAVGLKIPDSAVPGLRELQLEGRTKLAALRVAGRGPHDPLVRAAAKSLQRLDMDLLAAVVTLREILRTQLQLVDGQLVNLKTLDLVERRRQILESADFQSVLRAYLSERDKLDALRRLRL